jgi:hypothetical protein
MDVGSRGVVTVDSAPALVNEYHATYRSHGRNARIKQVSTRRMVDEQTSTHLV